MQLEDDGGDSLKPKQLPQLNPKLVSLTEVVGHGSRSKTWKGYHDNAPVILKFPFFKEKVAQAKSKSHAGPLFKKVTDETGHDDWYELAIQGKVGGFEHFIGHEVKVMCEEIDFSGFTFTLKQFRADDRVNRFKEDATGCLIVKVNQPCIVKKPVFAEMKAAECQCQVKSSVDNTDVVLEQLETEINFFRRFSHRLKRSEIIQARGVIEVSGFIQETEDKDDNMCKVRDMLKMLVDRTFGTYPRMHILVTDLEPSINLKEFERRMSQDETFRTKELQRYKDKIGNASKVGDTVGPPAAQAALENFALYNSLFWDLRRQVVHLAYGNFWKNRLEHFDLWEENVLVNLKTFEVKLCDFGMVQEWSADGTWKREDGIAHADRMRACVNYKTHALKLPSDVYSGALFVFSSKMDQKLLDFSTRWDDQILQDVEAAPLDQRADMLRDKLVERLTEGSLLFSCVLSELSVGDEKF